MMSEMDGYVETMCFANSMRDAVIVVVFSFFDRRTLRGGLGQLRERRSLLFVSVSDGMSVCFKLFKGEAYRDTWDVRGLAAR
jgi:hypothetical protein